MSFLQTRDLGPLPPAGSPLYARLQRVLRAAIDTGVLVPGAALPSERDLGDAYGLSRVTVRKAIDGLARQGVLIRRRGSGTFVPAEPVRAARLEKSFSSLSSFSEDMAARGRRAGSRWLGRRTGVVTPQEAMALGLSPGAAVHRFHRVRLADDEPMAVETSIIAGFALASHDAVRVSLYDALTDMGFRPVRALQRVRAEIAGTARATLLQVDANHAGLSIERRSFLGDGRIVETTNSFYRGDAYDLVAEMGG